MNSPALRMLLERLLWPVPRVRWEAGRSLARLIREGDREAARALLDWIGARQLESEAVLGLGIIDAFDLSAHFEFAEVSKAVRAPSYLSDWLLKKNFTDVSGLTPFRYVVSPSEPATLTQIEEAWFDRYLTWAVPPMFSDVLTWLQQSTDFPFFARWEHDWRWLQATHPRPAAEYPYFFSDWDRTRRGQFDQGQRELYVSAYLRTLAFAATRGMPNDLAERHAMLALTMNRGLADLEPIERPDWARINLPCDTNRMKELAQKLWVNAEAAAKPCEAPIALKVVDFDNKGFIELDLTLIIGPSGFVDGPTEAKNLDVLVVNECAGEMAGSVGQDADIIPFPIEIPAAMAQGVQPKNIGRVHINMASDVRLASPYVFGQPANIQCGHSEIRLESGTNVLSRWVHWYADWEPTIFPELESDVCSMTTVSKSGLDKLRASCDAEIAQMLRIRWASRPEVYQEYEVKEEAYWV